MDCLQKSFLENILSWQGFNVTGRIYCGAYMIIFTEEGLAGATGQA